MIRISPIWPDVKIKREGSSLIVSLDNEPVAIIQYVYPWIDNSIQWQIAENIAKDIAKLWSYEKLETPDE